MISAGMRKRRTNEEEEEHCNMKITDNESAIRAMTSDLRSTLRLLNGACRDHRIEPRDGCAYLKEHKHGCRSCRIGRLKERIKSHLEVIGGC